MRDIELYAKILGLSEPWGVETVEVDGKTLAVVVRVRLREAATLVCPECRKTMPGYDSRPRRWRHLDTCQYQTIIEADVPRGTCSEHGVRQIAVPWADDRSQFTALFERLVIDWLKQAGSQTAVARQFGMTWDEANGIMDRAVRRGLSREKSRGFRKIGVDETSFQKRHEYVTVVCDLERQRVIYVGDDRKTESLDRFYEGLTPQQKERIEAVAMDMWEPYEDSTRRHVPNAAIVFDKFHVVQLLNKAVDQVRRRENSFLRKRGDDRLVGSRYLWLANPDNMRHLTWNRFRPLRDGNLKTSRAWAIKETVMGLWDYSYARAATSFFNNWFNWAVRSKLDPIKKVARTLKRKLANVLTYLKHPITNARGEAINAKIQWLKYTARGFRNRDHFRTAILFHCGGLDLYPHESR